MTDAGIRIEGHELLQRLGERLEQLGQGDQRDRIGMAIWRTAAPLRDRARSHARAILPRRGGLNEVVAGTAMPISMRTRGRWRGVRIQATPDRANLRDPGAINRGRVRHPVYGVVREPDGPLIQMVRPGWFTTPMVEGAPAVRETIVQVIEEELRRLG